MNAIAIARKTLIAGFLAVTLLPVALLMTAYSRIYMPGLKSALDRNAFPPRTERDMLVNSRWGWYRVIDFVNRFVPVDALILVFRQNDIVFYGKRRVIRDVDPRMIPVYQQSDKERAYLELVKLGVSFFYLPEYSVPTIYNSPVGAVLADPELVRLVFEESGTRLYRLIPLPERRKLATRVVSGKGDEWTVYGDDRHWGALKLPYKAGRDPGKTRMIWLQSGKGSWLISPPPFPDRPRVVPGSTYVIRGSVKGMGWLTLHIVEYPRSSVGRVALRTLHRGAVTGRRDSGLAFQFRASSSAANFRFLLTYQGEGPIAIGPIEVLEVSNELPYGLKALGPQSSDSRRGLGPGSVLTSTDGGSVGHFTGPGHYLVPPTVYGVEAPPMPEIGQLALYRIHLEVSGRGNAQLAAVSFDVDGTPNAAALETIAIPEESAIIERILILPPDTREFRFGVVPISNSAAGVLEWTKRYFWHERPPAVNSFVSRIVVHDLRMGYAPRAIDEPELLNCVLQTVKAGPRKTPSLCQP